MPCATSRTSSLWGVTLEAFPLDKQLSSPIVANNAARVDDLIARYDLPFEPSDPALVRPASGTGTLIGQRRALADLIRLQLYGVLWSATGIDQVYPDDYTPAQIDFEADDTFHDFHAARAWTSPNWPSMFWKPGSAAAGDVPVILFNEPMLISAGENSDLRYNFFYPRWAYDQWRQSMSEKALANDWNYLDLWDLVPAAEFTNSAIHLTPAGEAILAKRLEQAILTQGCP